MIVEVLYFTSKNCGPCASFKNKWKEITKNNNESLEDIHNIKSIKYKKISYEKNKEYFIKYKIKSMPTILILVNGDKKECLSGLDNVNKIDKYLLKYL